MDPVVSTWAFGFGGWVGVLSTSILFVNAPQYSTFLTFLVSPWLGGISVYTLMYLTHCWIKTSIQIANAMMEQEIIMTVLMAMLSMTILAVFRTLIHLDREHRTQAEAAADETVQHATVDTVEEDESETGSKDDSESGDEDESDEESEGADGDDEESDETEDETGESASGETSDSSLNKARTDDASSYENIKTPQQATLTTTSVSPVPKIQDI